MATIKERIVIALKRDSYLDDDELAERLNVSPRQAINQAARQLEREGVIVRQGGPGRKIVNRLASRP